MLQKIYARFLLKNSKRLQSDNAPTCSTLPLISFIKVIVTGDLSYLGKLKNPEDVWQAIHSEYTELSGDTSNSRGLELAKQISFLTNKINITNLIVYQLSLRGRNEDLVIELKNMGYRLMFKDFEKDLERVLSLSKSDHIRLKDAQTQYKEIEKGEKTTEKDWYRILSALAKHRQVASINPALITVMEYICMDLEFKEYINAMKVR